MVKATFNQDCDFKIFAKVCCELYWIQLPSLGWAPTLHLFPWGLLLLHPGVLLVHRHHGQRGHARHHAVHGPVPAVPCNSVACHGSRVACGRVSPAGGGVLSAASSECGMNSCSAGSELMKPISRSDPSPAHKKLSLHQPLSRPCPLPTSLAHL